MPVTEGNLIPAGSKAILRIRVGIKEPSIQKILTKIRFWIPQKNIMQNLLLVMKRMEAEAVPVRLPEAAVHLPVSPDRLLEVPHVHPLDPLEAAALPIAEVPLLLEKDLPEVPVVFAEDLAIANIV